MEKNSYTSSSRRLPIVFICSIAILFVSQAILVRTGRFWDICYHYSDIAEDDGIRLEAQLKLIPLHGGQRKIFFIGSSQTREDFDIYYLNREFAGDGITFYNFGVAAGAMPIDMYMIIDKVLEKEPELIIYTPFVGSFYDEYNFYNMKFYFNPNVMPFMVEDVPFSVLYEHRKSVADSYLGFISVFYKYRESFKRIIFNLRSVHLRGEPLGEQVLFKYTENKPESYFREQIEQAGGNKYHETVFTDLNMELFGRLARKIVSSDVDFVVMDGPTHPWIRETYDTRLDTMYHDFVRTRADEIGFTYMSRYETTGFTEDDFIDFLHLNEQGRNKLTGFLRDYLVRELDLIGSTGNMTLPPGFPPRKGTTVGRKEMQSVH